MDNHYWAVRITKHALRDRTKHPALEGRDTAPTHDDQTRLYLFSAMHDMFGRVAHLDLCLELHSCSSRPLTQQSKTLLVVLASIFQNCIQFGAGRWLWRTDHSKEQQPGSHDFRHRKREVRRTLRLRRAIVGDKNDFKYLLCHALLLDAFRLRWLRQCLFHRTLLMFSWQQMSRQEEHIRNQGRNHGASNDRANHIGILHLS